MRQRSRSMSVVSREEVRKLLPLGLAPIAPLAPFSNDPAQSPAPIVPLRSSLGVPDEHESRERERIARPGSAAPDRERDRDRERQSPTGSLVERLPLPTALVSLEKPGSHRRHFSNVLLVKPPEDLHHSPLMGPHSPVSSAPPPLAPSPMAPPRSHSPGLGQPILQPAPITIASPKPILGVAVPFAVKAVTPPILDSSPPPCPISPKASSSGFSQFARQQMFSSSDPVSDLWKNDMTPDMFVNLLENAHAEQRRFWLKQIATQFSQAGAFVRISSELDLPKAINATIHVRAYLSHPKALMRKQETCSLLQCDRATLFLVDYKNNQLISKAAKGAQDLRFPLDAGIAGVCAKTNAIVNISDAYSDPRFNSSVDKISGYKTKSILCAPIRNRDGSTIAVLEALNKHNGDFSFEDERIVDTLSHQAGVAIDNSRNYDAAVLERQKVKALLKVTRDTISQVTDTNTLIRTIVKKSQKLTNADRASLYVVDKQTQELWTVVADSPLEIRMPISAGLAGFCASENKIVNIDDVYEDTRFNPAFDKESGYRTRSMLCIPVLSNKGEVIGVAQMINKKGNPNFTQDDEELLSGFCAQASLALEAAALFRQINDSKLLLQGIMGSINHLVLTLGETGQLLQANRDPEVLLGIPQEHFREAQYSAVFNRDNPRIARDIARVYSHGESIYRANVDFKRPDGRVIAINYSVVPLSSANILTSSFRLRGVVIIVEDLSPQKQLLSTLGRYMSPELAHQVVKEGGMKLGGVESKVTIVFVDIRGFTALSETLAPAQTVDMLNEYFLHVGTAVIKEGGNVNKYLGDGVMAIWGIPYAGPDDATHAIMACITIVRRVAAWNEKRKESNLAPIVLGLGVNTGLVLSGNIGFEKRLEYTVIGDEVNTCSRVEGATKVYGLQILITQSTYNEIKDAFHTREVDVVQVLGKTTSITLYEVIAPISEQLSPEKVQSLREFSDARKLYVEGKWDEADKLFTLSYRHCRDPAAHAMVRRCRRFKEKPPTGVWNGVWIMGGK